MEMEMHGNALNRTFCIALAGLQESSPELKNQKMHQNRTQELTALPIPPSSPKLHPASACRASSFGPSGLTRPRNVDFVLTPLSITSMTRSTTAVIPATGQCQPSAELW